MHILKDKIRDFKNELAAISPMAFKMIWLTIFQDTLCIGHINKVLQILDYD